MLLGSTASGWERGRFNDGGQFALPETNFILDGSGNLVRSLHVNYNERFVSGTAPSANHFADATVTYSGGTPFDHYANADMAIGRWTGGQMTVADNNNVLTTLVNDLGTTSSYWFMTKALPVNYLPSLIGTTTYTQVGATLPTDSFGNVGTLPGANLTADFTAQTVDASVAFTIANQGLTIANSAIPIVAGTEGFEGVIEFGTAPTVSCSGTGCVVSGGYEGWLTGGFAGDTASSAHLAYKIWPTASPDSLVTDIIQGIVAFYTATPPPVGPAKAYTPKRVAVETAAPFNFNNGRLANSSDLIYVAGGTSTSGALSSITTGDIGGGQNSVSTETISGGTATSADAPSFASTGIQYGAWTDYIGYSQSSSFTLGGNSHNHPSRWMYGPVGYLDAAYWTGSAVTGPMAATFSYQLDGAPAPRSMNSGFDGVLNSAYITANFATLLVSAGVDVTMPGNENWVASISGQPIDVFNSTFGSSSSVSYGAGVTATTCATCGGYLNGYFTGQNYAGAILSYEMYGDFTNGGDQVQGNAAFTRVGVAGNTVVSDGTPAPNGNIVVATDGWNGASIYTTATTAGNVLTAYGSSGPGYNQNTTISGCTTCTATASGQVTTSGIYYGTWDSGTYSSSWSNTFTAGTLSPSYWITGPEAGPLYLPQALTGTASYSFDAGQVTNGAGVAGAVAGTTTLALDFNKQTVGINLDLSIEDTATTPVTHTWNATTLTGNEALLTVGMGLGGGVFSASSNNNGNGSGLLTVTVDGGATSATIYNADINGQLTGVGLNGAIMSFDLSGQLNTALPTFESISGVAAFTGAAQAVNTSHRYVAMSYYDPFAVVPQPLFGFYANNDARVTQDVSGNLTQFDMQIMSTNGGNGSMTFASNTSTLADYGTDVATGISWGRWAGGTFNATDRVTGSVTPVTNAGSLHWIAESAATAATTLPLVGTYTYINPVGTTPTDNMGGTGTLNSATLTADFTAHTVNMGVNVTVAGATLDAVAANAPIIQRTAFYASSQEPAASTSHLAVTCTGGTACSTTLGGSVFGKFTGANAIGAVMTYGLQNGNSAVSGVAAFHQQ